MFELKLNQKLGSIYRSSRTPKFWYVRWRWIWTVKCKWRSCPYWLECCEWWCRSRSRRTCNNQPYCVIRTNLWWDCWLLWSSTKCSLLPWRSTVLSRWRGCRPERSMQYGFHHVRWTLLYIFLSSGFANGLIQNTKKYWQIWWPNLNVYSK